MPGRVAQPPNVSLVEEETSAVSHDTNDSIDTENLEISLTGTTNDATENSTWPNNCADKSTDYKVQPLGPVPRTMVSPSPIRSEWLTSSSSDGTGTH